MDIFSGFILGLVQGVTEFLPISSTGHLILVRDVLGISDAYGLTIDALLHLATALAVGIYFWKDIVRLVYAVLYRVTGRPVERRDEKLLLLLGLATIPGVIAGILLESYIESIFRSPILIAWILIAGSFVFFFAEWMGKRYEEHKNYPTYLEALYIGFFQVLALIPGMSRSGMTISGGLFFGLSREAATRFAFLLSFPIILGAGGKKLLDATTLGIGDIPVAVLSVALITAFVSGIITIHFLLKFVRHHSLTTFGVYRIILALSILYFLV